VCAVYHVALHVAAQVIPPIPTHFCIARSVCLCYIRNIQSRFKPVFKCTSSCS